jgi:hypothetical protein
MKRTLNDDGRRVSKELKHAFVKGISASGNIGRFVPPPTGWRENYSVATPRRRRLSRSSALVAEIIR